MLASIFLYYGPRNFTPDNVALAIEAGMPLPNVLVPIGGVLALFLIPTLVLIHAFWKFEGGEAQAQIANFLRNLSLLGGALLVTHFGAGPYSFDNRQRR
jgi:putative oxidoreductase